LGQTLSKGARRRVFGRVVTITYQSNFIGLSTHKLRPQKMNLGSNVQFAPQLPKAIMR